ncbi:MAG TPA: single-stranded-DNA-specific exonuclease RecJ [Candidatus Izemoplasmatales bacterium]|nr:single-stranded-DNA-specific exonuclease RecJ [Candidatus Izemoplasmatales bacterium]
MLKAKYGWKVAVPAIVPDAMIFDHILKNRGIDDVDRFFRMGKESLHDPFGFEDMDKAVRRIIQAISAHEKIVIYGDYDCDGITAIAVLFRALRSLGAEVAFDLPDRFSDGYGLNMRAVEDLIHQGVQLVITVDNGITCRAEIARLRDAGIDTIVTDHHSLVGDKPEAYAILHAPTSATYPFKELAGVGVSYKLASAVLGSTLDASLDLVAVGTIADLVLLDGENQAIVNLGLARLAKTTNPGLKKLIQFSHLEEINLTAVAFKIAPKINSSGRMGRAKDAVRLLISDSEEEVNRLILDIEANHAERKDLTDEAYAECERLVEDGHNVLVLASPRLHEGVIGICAQKIAEKYQKSTCVICTGEDQLGKGSMRSFGNDDILGFLKESADLLVRYGGHSQAAGLAIDIANIPRFQERLDCLAVAQPVPDLPIDMQVRLSEVSLATIRKLDHYSFFTARFLFSDLTVVGKTVMTGKHTKLSVTDGDKTVEAIDFNHLDYFRRLEVGDRIDVVGGLSINSWRGKETIQILIKDLACRHFQVLDWRRDAAGEPPGYAPAPEELILDETIPPEAFDVPELVQKKRPTTVAVRLNKHRPLWDRFLNKDGIGSIFRLIQKRPETTMDTLMAEAKAPEWAIAPIVQVFEDLHLVIRSEGHIALQEPQEKRNLADSRTYNRLMEAQRQWAFLTEEPLSRIRTYLTHLLEAIHS